MHDPILVADIGGTNARFAIAMTEADGSVAVRDGHAYLAKDFDTPADAATAYLDRIGERPVSGCFAVAGPIINDEVRITNSHWTLRKPEIVNALRLKEFQIINDFHALAASVEHLPDDAFVAVKSGSPIAGTPLLVVGPGTGLGQALAVPAPSGVKVVSTEGGHVLFAPCTDEEVEIQKFIAHFHRRVCVERLLSGDGIENIYRALCSINDQAETFSKASEITEAAIADSDAMAVKAVNMFCSILGRTVGDGVLATGARGGVVLVGGILPKIQTFFLRSAFVENFIDKGRMADYVSSVPVRLVVKDSAGLVGAAAAMEKA